MKRLVVAILSAGAVFVLTSMTMGTTWSAAAGPPTATPVFDDAARQVTLTIPTPPCAPGQEGCKWLLFVNEPDVPGKPVVDSVTGTVGVLTVQYPPNFCGVLQADARTGPPWVQVRGLRHTVSTDHCPPPPTITTTTTTTTTTTSTTAPPVPPIVAAGGQPPAEPATPARQPAVLPFTAGEAASPSTSAPTSGAVATRLPFTGLDTKPLWILGLSLVAFGLTLLGSGPKWRRLLHRLGYTRRST